jgi:CheY-like chemotaxis protein
MLQGMRVLVIEDDRELRDVFAALLRADGATVAEVESGRAALWLMRTRDFHAVLSDLSLPDIFGEVLIRQLVAADRGRAPVVVVTGHGEPHLTRARAAGARAVFCKPVEWDRILACLARLKRSQAA